MDFLTPLLASLAIVVTTVTASLGFLIAYTNYVHSIGWPFFTLRKMYSKYETEPQGFCGVMNIIC